MSNEVHTLFPTTVVTRQWAGEVDTLNHRLKAELDKMRAYDPDGIYRSNTAGTWHSRDTVLTECGPAGRQLAEMFNQQFATLAANNGGGDLLYAFKMQAWAMRYADRGYATVHTHPNCHFSGVYYVTGEAEEAADKVMATGVTVPPGTLEFIDTRGINIQVPGLRMQPAARFRPRAGLMVVFPSWLPHFVHPVEGDAERISIACNATLVDTKEKQQCPPLDS